MANRYKRGAAKRAPRNRIFVFVEGKATEKDYFTRLRSEFHIPKELVPIECTHYTDLGSILEACVKHRRKALSSREAQDSDQWWVVADTEGQEIARELIAKAQKNHVNLCVSGPAFEFWLLLHFGYSARPYIDANAATAAFDRLMPGYKASGKHPDMDGLLPRVPDAVSNASRLRLERDNAESVHSCTDCDLLVAAMNAQSMTGCELFHRSEVDVSDLFVARH